MSKSIKNKWPQWLIERVNLEVLTGQPFGMFCKETRNFPPQQPGTDDTWIAQITFSDLEMRRVFLYPRLRVTFKWQAKKGVGNCSYQENVTFTVTQVHRENIVCFPSLSLSVLLSFLLAAFRRSTHSLSRFLAVPLSAPHLLPGRFNRFRQTCLTTKSFQVVRIKPATGTITHAHIHTPTQSFT